MNARDELRRYVNLMGDMWTSPKVTDERVEQLYAAVRAEVLAEQTAEVDRLRESLVATKRAWAAADEQAGHERGRRTADTYLAAAALVEDRACDADFTHDPQHIAGLREAAELLTRRAGEVR